MNEEKIIRKEAEDFYERKLNTSNSYKVINDFNNLKIRLDDFYTEDYKAIFLEEIENSLTYDLKKHRDEKHGGLASETCGYEIYAEKFLFYLKQELSTLPAIARQKFDANNEIIKEKVFISYSHSDNSFLTEIQRHFKPFLNKIDYWDDTKILPGQKWKEEIENALKQTKVAILLISTDFLGSDFVMNHELPKLLKSAEKDGTVILSVILKPCLFEEFADLNKFQAMNPPSRPISKMSEDERDDILVNLVRQTKRILNK
jgi:TIR domain